MLPVVPSAFLLYFVYPREVLKVVMLVRLSLSPQAQELSAGHPKTFVYCFLSCTQKNFPGQFHIGLFGSFSAWAAIYP